MHKSEHDLENERAEEFIAMDIEFENEEIAERNAMEREMADEEIASLKADVDYCRERGGATADERCRELQSYICAKEELLRLSDVERPASGLRIEELKRQIAEAEEKGRDWAQNVEIKIAPLPAVLQAYAVRRFRLQQSADSLILYCRDEFTNYREVANEANFYVGETHTIIEGRFDSLVLEALVAAGATV